MLHIVYSIHGLASVTCDAAQQAAGQAGPHPVAVRIPYPVDSQWHRPYIPQGMLVPRMGPGRAAEAAVASGGNTVRIRGCPRNCEQEAGSHALDWKRATPLGNWEGGIRAMAY